MKIRYCAQVRPELKAFADGELSLLQQLRVARHLRLCPDCQKELIQMQTLSEKLKPTETEVEPVLETELRAKILAGAPTVASTEVLRRRRRVARKKTVLALGAASLAGGLLWVGVQNGSGFGAGAPTMSNSVTTSSESIASDESSPSPSSASSAGTSSAGEPSAGTSSAVPSNAPSVSDTRATVAGAVTSRAGRAVPPAVGNKSQLESEQSLSPSNIITADGHVKVLERNRAELSRGAVDNFGRSAGDSTVLSMNGAAKMTQNLNGSSNGALSVVPQTRAVHREGSVSVAVNDAEQSSDETQRLIKNAGGFVANTALETGSNGRRTATLDCRIPAEKFEALVSKIGQLGTVRAKSLSGQDITAQIAQSGARRQTLQQELAIAQARLAQKEKNAKKRDAGQIYVLRSDVRQVRLQAAQARAQLETLQRYGNTSSLFVSLQDRSPVKASGAGLSDSLGLNGNATWNAFLQNARVPFQLLLLVLAYVPIWLPALLLWRKFGRKWLAE